MRFLLSHACGVMRLLNRYLLHNSPREGATDHCMMVVGTESVKVSVDTSMPNFTLTLQRRVRPSCSVVRP